MRKSGSVENKVRRLRAGLTSWLPSPLTLARNE